METAKDAKKREGGKAEEREAALEILGCNSRLRA